MTVFSFLCCIQIQITGAYHGDFCKGVAIFTTGFDFLLGWTFFPPDQKKG